MPNVVFIPGVPGTELFVDRGGGRRGKRVFVPRPFTKMRTLPAGLKRRLKGPDNLTVPDGVIAGEPVKSVRFAGFDLSKQADHLYKILRQCGVSGSSLAGVGWDWRRPVTDPEALLRVRAAITRFGTDVTVIVHSTGGLLLRHLLASEPALVPRLRQVIAFGVPWAGALKSWAVLVGQRKFGITPKKKAQELFASAWSAFDLLPRGKAGLVVDGAGGQVDPTVPSHRSWIPSAYTAKMNPRLDLTRAQLGRPGQQWEFSTPLWNVVGWGWPTDVVARLASSGQVFFNPAALTRGERAFAGDGTAAEASAGWIRGAPVRTLYVPIGGYQASRGSRRKHSSLWRNPGGRALLHHRLAGAGLPDFAYVTVDWSDKVDPGASTVRLRFVMQRLDGSPLTGGRLHVTNVSGRPSFAIDASGRGLARLPRSAFPRVHQNRFRRIETELRHTSFTAPRRSALVITR